MNLRPSTRRGSTSISGSILALAAGALVTSVGLPRARGQADKGPPDSGPQRPGGFAPNKVPEESAVFEQGTQAAPGVAPWLSSPFVAGMSLDWHGGLEMDVGYASFTHDNPAYPPERFDDFRGRFVLGPVLQRDFGNGFFFRSSGQVVAWIREQRNIYQINVDDVYVQFGQKGVWDFTAGRFMTWRVYRKGLGWDLYTLEDTGATTRSYDPNSTSDFYPHTYEVDEIFYRDIFGRAALHVYPTSWSGLEVAGQYGRLDQFNDIGGRVALGIAVPHLSITAGGEYDARSPAVQSGTNDSVSGEFLPCDPCGKTKRVGGGGGAVVKFKPIELGANYATEKVDTNQLMNGGSPDLTASFKRTSYGGYAELDVGSLVFGRMLLVGGGLNRTERLTDDDNFLRHTQWTAYVAYPLGFNNAVLKFVFSRADGFARANAGGLENRDQMVSGRVRLRFDY